MGTRLRFQATEYPGATRQRPHRHDELHLSIVLRGRIAESVGGATEVARAWSVLAKDPEVVHADTFGPEGALVARLSFGGGIAELLDDPARLRAWRWSHEPAVARAFLRIVARLAVAGDAPEVDADDADVVDLLASLTARGAPTADGSPPAWLAETVRAMRDDWRASLQVRDVAARAGVHPVYLARCLRRWYGRGVRDELRAARRRAAADALLSSRERVSRLAHALGYADEAHLCRDFRAATDLPPGRYRALMARLTSGRAGA